MNSFVRPIILFPFLTRIRSIERGIKMTNITHQEISQIFATKGFMVLGAWLGMIGITMASLVIAYMNMHTVLFKVNRRMQSMKEKMDLAEKLMGERKFPDELLGLLSNVLKIDKEADEAMTQSKMAGL